MDLRCHGDSASIKKRGAHTVVSAALDVLKLVCNSGHHSIRDTLFVSCIFILNIYVFLVGIGCTAQINTTSLSWTQLWWKRYLNKHAYNLNFDL